MLKGLSLLAATEIRAAVGRKLAALAFYAGAGVFALFALAFLLVALDGWLALRFGHVEASLYVAPGLAVVAAIVFAIGAYRKSQPVERSPLASTALVAAPVAAQTLARRVNLGTIGLIAVVVGGALIGRRLARN